MKYLSATFVAIVSVTLLVPVPVFAVCPSGTSLIPSGPPENFTEVVCLLTNNINTVFPIIIGLAVIVFFWGLAKFIRSAGDEKQVSEGKKIMLWGVIGIFIMLSIWGIVQILYSSFFGEGSSIGVPLLPTS